MLFFADNYKCLLWALSQGLVSLPAKCICYDFVSGEKCLCLWHWAALIRDDRVALGCKGARLNVCFSGIITQRQSTQRHLPPPPAAAVAGRIFNNVTEVYEEQSQIYLRPAAQSIQWHYGRMTTLCVSPLPTGSFQCLLCALCLPIATCRGLFHTCRGSRSVFVLLFH